MRSNQSSPKDESFLIFYSLGEIKAAKNDKKARVGGRMEVARRVCLPAVVIIKFDVWQSELYLAVRKQSVSRNL